MVNQSGSGVKDAKDNKSGADATENNSGISTVSFIEYRAFSPNNIYLEPLNKGRLSLGDNGDAYMSEASFKNAGIKKSGNIGANCYIYQKDFVPLWP